MHIDNESIKWSLSIIVITDIPWFAIDRRSLPNNYRPTWWAVQYGRIKPRLKKPTLNPEDLNSYRPISNRSF